jgi:hypothetical protein
VPHLERKIAKGKKKEGRVKHILLENETKPKKRKKRRKDKTQPPWNKIEIKKKKRKKKKDKERIEEKNEKKERRKEKRKEGGGKKMDLKVKVIKLNLKKVEEEGSSQFGPSKDWPGGEQTRAAAAPTLRKSKTETFAVGQAHGCIKRLLHVREARPRFCHAGSENGILVKIARVRYMDCRVGPRVVYGTEPTNKLYEDRLRMYVRGSPSSSLSSSSSSSSSSPSFSS